MALFSSSLLQLMALDVMLLAHFLRLCCDFAFFSFYLMIFRLALVFYILWQYRF